MKNYVAVFAILVAWGSSALAQEPEPNSGGEGLQTIASAAVTGGGLVVDSAGRVGIGTDTPNRVLHVVSDTGAARLDVQEVGASPATRLMFVILNNGTPSFRLQNTQNAGKIWDMSGRLDRYVFRDVLDGVDRLAIRDNGNVEAQLFVNTSSRAAKRAFETVSPDELLDHVLALPISEWSYKNDAGGARHIGPVAEDFYEMLGLGSDGQHIAASDTAGVALAANKGLSQRLEERDRLVGELGDVVEMLKARIEHLETAAGTQ